jgi:hypothetical protein
MRKKEIFEDKKRVEAIINKCDICFVAMSDEKNMPYIVPMNFGYKDDCFYFHSGPDGKKLDILEKNNNVSISLSTGHSLKYQNVDVACSYLMTYQSIIAFGKVEFIENYDQKVDIMNIIMQKYTGRDFKFGKPSINEIKTFKVKIEKITGKELSY